MSVGIASGPEAVVVVVETGTGLTFGELLRRFRDNAGLTQEDLADRTGLTPQAIGLLERGERRRPHRYTVQKLAEALQLMGGDLAAFEAAARRPSARRPATTAAAEPSRRTLPAPLTPLIGREREVAAVTSLLRREEVRLLTLTGPGGVGKTRLALEVAERSREAFSDGVVFVALAPLRDPEVLPSALAETLGVRDAADRALQETLKQHLQDKQMLLLLDNFEHLLAATLVVAELVEACPALTVLATSRASLHLTGEQQFPVQPLALPEAAFPESVEALAHYPAVELFCQRARAVTPDFELTAANASTVARICQRLDGAITLAKLGSIEYEMGRDARASQLYAESLELMRRFGFRSAAVDCLGGVARVAAIQGQPERAARLLGASAALRDEMGAPLAPTSRADHDHATNAARAALGEEAFAAAWAEGRAVSFEEAITDALGDDE